MTRWQRIKLSGAIAFAAFLLQVLLLVFDVQLVDERTGQFRLGAELRFKFVDETTRQFVLVSQLQELPQQLLVVLEISLLVALASYAATGWTDKYLQPTPREDSSAMEQRSVSLPAGPRSPKGPAQGE